MKKMVLIFIILTLDFFHFALALEKIDVKLLKVITFSDYEIPSDVIIKDNNMYILESRYGFLSVYSLNNFRLISKIKLDDSEGSISICKFKGNFYVTIPLKNKINIYNSLYKKMGEKSIQTPTDIKCFDDNCFVVSNKQHKIIKMDYMLRKIIDEVGGFGYNKNEFRFPFSIDVSSKGDIFVSEVINTRVQIFNKDLKFVDFIGSWGVDVGQFYRPKGVALYKDRYLFVSDGYLGVIQAFDIDTKAIKGVVYIGNNVLKLNSPSKLTIFNKILVVVDTYDKKVFIYKLS